MLGNEHPGIGQPLAGCPLQPVQGGARTLRQTVAAKEVTLAQGQLRLGLSGTRCADDCKILASGHPPSTSGQKAKIMPHNRIFFKKHSKRFEMHRFNNITMGDTQRIKFRSAMPLRRERLQA
ncbi:hypothetical protein J2S30_003169 [Herbaspirillum rubrisubalbicans]|nr:hypothetical protein [Herbaspirillum rubrisubalbicans]